MGALLLVASGLFSLSGALRGAASVEGEDRRGAETRRGRRGDDEEARVVLLRAVVARRGLPAVGATSAGSYELCRRSLTWTPHPR